MSLFPVKIPSMGESISQVIVSKMLKKTGEIVEAQEEILELETDKVNQVISSPISGKLHWQVHEGDSVTIGQVVAQIDPKIEIEKNRENSTTLEKNLKKKIDANEKSKNLIRKQEIIIERDPKSNQGLISVEFLKEGYQQEQVEKNIEKIETNPSDLYVENQPTPFSQAVKEKRSKLSILKRTMANRLLQSQSTSATLTTFNEIDMSEVMKCREHYKEDFFKRHGVKLGLMSFFTKAIVQALEKVPSVGARIDGEEWVEPLTYDIGIAVSTDRGLLVPVLRSCERLSLAEIERSLFDVASRAREGRVHLEELSGGCFTISNAGVFGSLLSTPIINPPQSAILGMHKIEKRAIVIESDQIVVRPMMYVALSYDHRVIDGKEAVSFLVDVKESIEQPERMLLDI